MIVLVFFDSDCLKTIVFEDNRFSVLSSKFPVENFVINNLVYLRTGLMSVVPDLNQSMN